MIDCYLTSGVILYRVHKKHDSWKITLHDLSFNVIMKYCCLILMFIETAGSQITLSQISQKIRCFTCHLWSFFHWKRMRGKVKSVAPNFFYVIVFILSFMVQKINKMLLLILVIYQHNLVIVLLLMFAFDMILYFI